MTAPTYNSIMGPYYPGFGTSNWTHTPGGNSRAIAMPYARQDKWQDIADPTYGGLTLALINGYQSTWGNQEGYAGLFHLTDWSGKSGDGCSATATYSGNIIWSVLLDHADGELTLIDSGVAAGTIENGGTLGVTLDPDGTDCIVVVIFEVNGTVYTQLYPQAVHGTAQDVRDSRDWSGQTAKVCTVPLLAADGAASIGCQVWGGSGKKSIFVAAAFGYVAGGGGKPHSSIFIG